jgi:hypothetical protein
LKIKKNTDFFEIRLKASLGAKMRTKASFGAFYRLEVTFLRLLAHFGALWRFWDKLSFSAVNKRHLLFDLFILIL